MLQNLVYEVKLLGRPSSSHRGRPWSLLRLALREELSYEVFVVVIEVDKMPYLHLHFIVYDVL